MITVCAFYAKAITVSVYVEGHSRNTTYGRMMNTIRSVRGRINTEQRMNFAPYKDKGKKSWSVKLVCLASKDANRVPMTAAERELLVAAGLGEKRIQIPNINCSWNDFKGIILTAFPSLNDCGGFEFLRCVSNTKDLELIRLSVAQSPKLLKEMIANGRVFIRPIQKDLVLHDQEELTAVAQVRM